MNVFMNNYGGLNHTHKQFSFQSPLERSEKVFQAKVILPSHDDVSESLLPACRFSVNNLFINLFSNWRKIVSLVAIAC